jgi:hypothetical protein
MTAIGKDAAARRARSRRKDALDRLIEQANAHQAPAAPRPGREG